MNLLLEARSVGPLIILKLVLVAHTDDLSWYIMYNQPGQMIVQTST